MFIAIDIGGSKTRLAGSHIGTALDGVITIPTPQNQRQASQALQQAILELAERSPIDAIGIAAPGPINKKTGTILTPDNLTWHNFRIVEALKKHFECPVILEHDADCGGLAEAKLGAGRNFNLFVYTTISTGIGTAIILANRPLPSPHNSEGGRMIVGQTQNHHYETFEQQVSGRAIIQRFNQPAGKINNNHIWDIIAHDLGVGLYNLSTIVQPEAIVLAGGVSVHHKKFTAKLRRQFEQLPFLYAPPVLVVAKFVETAPLLGAVLLAVEAAEL